MIENPTSQAAYIIEKPEARAEVTKNLIDSVRTCLRGHGIAGDTAHAPLYPFSERYDLKGPIAIQVEENVLTVRSEALARSYFPSFFHPSAGAFLNFQVPFVPNGAGHRMLQLTYPGYDEPMIAPDLIRVGIEEGKPYAHATNGYHDLRYKPPLVYSDGVISDKYKPPLPPEYANSRGFDKGREFVPVTMDRTIADIESAILMSCYLVIVKSLPNLPIPSFTHPDLDIKGWETALRSIHELLETYLDNLGTKNVNGAHGVPFPRLSLVNPLSPGRFDPKKGN